MLQRLVSALEQQQLKMAAAKGGLACPQCGESPAMPPTKPEAILTCEACGHFGSASEWVPANLSAPASRAGVPPAGTRIQRETLGTTVVWDIPPSGKSGGLIAFGWVWTTFIAFFTSLVLYSFLFGTPGKDNGPLGFLFLIPFWAVGLGMLHIGYRMKNARHKVVIGDGKVTLTREWRGKVKKKSLPLAELETIHQTVFYSKNYTPVYGIELKGRRGKLRFGSSLEETDKAWLVAEFKAAAWPAKATLTNPPPVEPVSISQGTQPFSVLIPRSDSLLGFGLTMALIGAAFICIGIFVLDDMNMKGSSSGLFERIFDGIFTVLTGGFRALWCVMSSVFFLIGVGMLARHFHQRETEQRLEGTRENLILRKMRKGLTLKEQTFARASFLDIRATQNGNVNNQPRMKVELLADGRSTIISRWMKPGDAEALVESVKAAMRGS
jgi:hypothetical protein